MVLVLGLVVKLPAQGVASSTKTLEQLDSLQELSNRFTKAWEKISFFFQMKPSTEVSLRCGFPMVDVDPKEGAIYAAEAVFARFDFPLAEANKMRFENVDGLSKHAQKNKEREGWVDGAVSKIDRFPLTEIDEGRFELQYMGGFRLKIFSKNKHGFHCRYLSQQVYLSHGKSQQNLPTLYRSPKVDEKSDKTISTDYIVGPTFETADQAMECIQLLAKMTVQSKRKLNPSYQSQFRLNIPYTSTEIGFRNTAEISKWINEPFRPSLRPLDLQEIESRLFLALDSSSLSKKTVLYGYGIAAVCQVENFLYFTRLNISADEYNALVRKAILYYFELDQSNSVSDGKKVASNVSTNIDRTLSSYRETHRMWADVYEKDKTKHNFTTHEDLVRAFGRDLNELMKEIKTEFKHDGRKRSVVNFERVLLNEHHRLTEIIKANGFQAVRQESLLDKIPDAPKRKSSIQWKSINDIAQELGLNTKTKASGEIAKSKPTESKAGSTTVIKLQKISGTIQVRNGSKVRPLGKNVRLELAIDSGPLSPLGTVKAFTNDLGEFSFDLSNYALKHEVYKLFLGKKVIWSETVRNTEHLKINITIDEKDLDKNKAS